MSGSSVNPSDLQHKYCLPEEVIKEIILVLPGTEIQSLWLADPSCFRQLSQQNHFWLSLIERDFGITLAQIRDFGLALNQIPPSDPRCRNIRELSKILEDIPVEITAEKCQQIYKSFLVLSGRILELCYSNSEMEQIKNLHPIAPTFVYAEAFRRASKKSNDPEILIRVFEKLLNSCSTGNEIIKAENIADTIQDPLLKSKCMHLVCNAYCSIGVLDCAARTFNKISSRDDQISSTEIICRMIAEKYTEKTQEINVSFWILILVHKDRRYSSLDLDKIFKETQKINPTYDYNFVILDLLMNDGISTVLELIKNGKLLKETEKILKIMPHRKEQKLKHGIDLKNYLAYELIFKYLESGKIKDAKRVVNLLTDKPSFERASSAIFNASIAAGDISGASAFLKLLSKRSHSREFYKNFLPGINNIFKAYIEAGDISGAHAFLESLTKRFHRFNFLLFILHNYLENGKESEAEKVMDIIKKYN